jgi:hypothetical protein
MRQNREASEVTALAFNGGLMLAAIIYIAWRLR